MEYTLLFQNRKYFAIVRLYCSKLQILKLKFLFQTIILSFHLWQLQHRSFSRRSQCLYATFLGRYHKFLLSSNLGSPMQLRLHALVSMQCFHMPGLRRILKLERKFPICLYFCIFRDCSVYTTYTILPNSVITLG